VKKSISLKPIGYVRNSIRPHENTLDYHDEISEIIIEDSLREAMEGLEDNSHLTVVFWMDRVPEDDRGLMKVHPCRRDDLPLVGILATKAPNRPNGIGISVVELLGREMNVLKVKGLDAWNETPVLDIKPFTFTPDTLPAIRGPWWAGKL
jgi:tRNA-Thr(GGU) m(6)t(6)A37 methyltransferase TsaA